MSNEENTSQHDSDIQRHQTSLMDEDVDNGPTSPSAMTPKKMAEVTSRLKKLAEKLGLSSEYEARFSQALLAQKSARKVFVLPPHLIGKEPEKKADKTPITKSKQSVPTVTPPKLEDIPWVNTDIVKELPASAKAPAGWDIKSSYSLDLSSVFMISPLLSLKKEQGVDKMTHWSCLDACASPGGKSVLLSSLLRPDILVANEKNPHRLKALIANFSRLSLPNASITNYDARSIFHRLNSSLSLVLLDAPCSGQALIGKGFIHSSSLTPITANTSAGLQRALLHKAAPALRPGGYLLYMTCTFSREENEKVIHSFLNTQKDFSTCEIDLLSKHQSHLAEFPCYRLWPWEMMGAGGFTCLLKKDGELTTETNESKKQIKSALAKVCWSSL